MGYTDAFRLLKGAAARCIREPDQPLLTFSITLPESLLELIDPAFLDSLIILTC
jgi:hypothetical protein